MLKRLFKKTQPKLYLGSITVSPRTDFKRHLDEWDITGKEDLSASIQNALIQVFDLPLAMDAKATKKHDLALDVAVTKFQLGQVVRMPLVPLGLPLVWRPKLEIGARLFNISSGKTVRIATITVKLPWNEFISRMFSWRSIAGFRKMFDSSDLNTLLHKACYKLLFKIRKDIRHIRN